MNFNAWTFGQSYALCQGGNPINDAKFQGRVTSLNHISIVKHLVSVLRDKSTDTKTFRHYSDRIMRLLVEEAIAQDLAEPVRKLSPTGDYYNHYAPKFEESEYAAITIIRAGDSMLSEVFNLIPGISIGKVLIQRDESTADKRPVFYYSKLPDDIGQKKRVLVLDPMLATGGSASVCIQKLRDMGVASERIVFINLVSAERGLDRLLEDHPGVKVITACLDDGMNGEKYIVPGLGDFGDRYFGSRLPK